MPRGLQSAPTRTNSPASPPSIERSLRLNGYALMPWRTSLPQITHRFDNGEYLPLDPFDRSLYTIAEEPDDASSSEELRRPQFSSYENTGLSHYVSMGNSGQYAASRFSIPATQDKTLSLHDRHASHLEHADNTASTTFNSLEASLETRLRLEYSKARRICTYIGIIAPQTAGSGNLINQLIGKLRKASSQEISKVRQLIHFEGRQIEQLRNLRLTARASLLTLYASNMKWADLQEARILIDKELKVTANIYKLTKAVPSIHSTLQSATAQLRNLVARNNAETTANSQTDDSDSFADDEASSDSDYEN